MYYIIEKKIGGQTGRWIGNYSCKIDWLSDDAETEAQAEWDREVPDKSKHSLSMPARFLCRIITIIIVISATSNLNHAICKKYLDSMQMQKSDACLIL